MDKFKPFQAVAPHRRDVQIKFDSETSEALRIAARRANLPVCHFAAQAIAFAIANMEAR